jgi:hypothetical protein
MGQNISDWNCLLQKLQAVRDLATLCKTFAPEESKLCQHWYSNDGDGLNAEQSGRLAQRLEAALGDGSIDRLREYLERAEELGVRARLEYLQSVGCAMFAHYDATDPYIVAEFLEFLRTCGGFVIR